jgi:hypothetical protein
VLGGSGRRGKEAGCEGEKENWAGDWLLGRGKKREKGRAGEEAGPRGRRGRRTGRAAVGLASLLFFLSLFYFFFKQLNSI